MRSGPTISRRGLLAGTGAAAALGPSARVRAQALQGRLNYWHHFTSQTEAKGLARIVALFQQRHPGLQLAPENIPNAEYMTKVTAAVVAGSKPDTGMVSVPRFPDLHAMGGLVDLSAKIAAWPDAKDFAPTAFDAASKAGKRYGIPAFSFVGWAYWRKDYLEQAGLSGPPDTMEQFLDACLKVTDASKNRYGFGMRGGDGGHQFVIDMIEAWGSPLVEGGKMAIDKAKATEAVRFYAELFTKAKVVPPSAPNDSYRQLMEAFRTGQTAMVWHHTGSLTEIVPALPQGSFGTAIRPKGPAARIAPVDHLYNAVMRPDRLEPGWAWVSFWGEADPAIALLEETGYFPANAKVAKDPRITANPLYAAATETLGFGKPPPSFTGYENWARTQAFPEFQKILVGNATPEQVVDRMMRSLEKTLG
jgi:multiple sugar transport system substrate-binding protein